MKKQTKQTEKGHSPSKIILSNGDARRNMQRHPHYWELKTGDMFTTSFRGPQAIVVGFMKNIPGIEGVTYGGSREDLIGYAPLLYFENAGKPSLWNPNKEPAKLLARTGLNGLSEDSWLNSGIGGTFKYFEETAFRNPLEMLIRAKEYALSSHIPIYSGQDVGGEEQERLYLEKHRLEIGKFIKDKLSSL
ncbi:hypothetical protein J4430_01120 [Candidatus Woesearchaeota archaeon]|nr:hypothetical protein [Candidatus Woesearchaeota archaeon]